jgi:hypothetical protein
MYKCMYFNIYKCIYTIKSGSPTGLLLATQPVIRAFHGPGPFACVLGGHNTAGLPSTLAAIKFAASGEFSYHFHQLARCGRVKQFGDALEGQVAGGNATLANRDQNFGSQTLHGSSCTES